MEDTLITFTTAKLAKEKGFSINTTEYWEYQALGPERYKFITEDTPGATWVNDDLKNRICISTQSLLQKWLRDNHNIIVFVNPYPSFYGVVIEYNNRNSKYSIHDLASWELALEKGLQTALKLIKTI